MGRLIDADKAQKDYITTMGKRSLIIDIAETVEAIPVDWIKKKQNGLVSDYKYIIDWLILEWEKEQGEINNGNQ